MIRIDIRTHVHSGIPHFPETGGRLGKGNTLLLRRSHDMVGKDGNARLLRSRLPAGRKKREKKQDEKLIRFHKTLFDSVSRKDTQIEAPLQDFRQGAFTAHRQFPVRHTLPLAQV